MKQSVEVEANVPEGVTIGEWITYVRESVMTLKGAFHPSDPLFYLDRASVKVRRMIKSQPKTKG